MAARPNILQLTGIVHGLYLPAPKKTHRPASFASFVSILPMTDRLQVAQRFAKENGKSKSFNRLDKLLAQAHESPSPNILGYMRISERLLLNLGFSLEHRIITARPKVLENPNAIEIECAKEAIYHCILARDDEIVHELIKHFKLDEDTVLGCAHDAAMAEIKHGRYISAKEIAQAYRLDGVRKRLERLRTIFEKIDSTKSLQMFGPLNECDGSG